MATSGHTLGSLGLGRLDHAGPAPDLSTAITGLAVDSRLVRDGFLFVAMPGTKLDGATFAQYAVRQGAAAVIVTPEGLEVARSDIGELPVPFLISDNPRAELSRLASEWYGAQPETMVAVTGTNGKTSVAHFTGQIWRALGRRAAAFGTTGVEGDGFEEPLGMTTPEPLMLHALLARLAEKGCTHAAMEASSHGLAQHRVDGVRLAAAGLTNITRDHMDYHRDHDDYVGAKLRLFHSVLPRGGWVAVNADDPVFPLVRLVSKERHVLPVGRSDEASLRLLDTAFHGEGQRISFSWEGETYTRELSLIGGFQAENALLAAALAIATGEDAAAVFDTLPGLTNVRGRMERVATRANGATVYVDYAHTPDALRTAISALRPHCAGRLVVVFGAGGDRDPGKRPLMGAAVAELADHAIITDDNPRTEDPAAIRAAIAEAAPQAEIVGSRAEAILAGVDALKEAGDCLLIAGKGHEQGQEIAGIAHPFDDAEQARIAVQVLDGEEGA